MRKTKWRREASVNVMVTSFATHWLKIQGSNIFIMRSLKVQSPGLSFSLFFPSGINISGLLLEINTLALLLSSTVLYSEVILILKWLASKERFEVQRC